MKISVAYLLMQKHLKIIKAETTGETSFRHHPESLHLGSLTGRVTYKNWTRDIAARRGLTQQFVACNSSSTSHSLWSLTVPHIMFWCIPILHKFCYSSHFRKVGGWIWGGHRVVPKMVYTGQNWWTVPQRICLLSVGRLSGDRLKLTVVC